MAALLPLDAHAHVLTSIDERDLRELRAVTFAVTREPSEWTAATHRRDKYCVWGLGCHPQVPRAVDAFDADRLHELTERAPLIGEVGLDRRSKVPKDTQRTVFRSALEVAADRSRLVSIHSVGMSAEVLEELSERPVAGAILHWWRGTPAQTTQALELGCHFSLNGAEARNPKVLSLLPPDRVLTETDYPHTERSDRAADKPGAVSTIEAALALAWGEDTDGVRRQVWRNLGAICQTTRTSALMPRAVQATLLSMG
ncbi:MAG: TatD DNase family protein [Solirubrobacteraceae bacterium]|jgi:TatD DNase family protein|nr:TatD DNase family protein [Solirubrobacteraceae bacterium]